jgi:hypothetical protein
MENLSFSKTHNGAPPSKEKIIDFLDNLVLLKKVVPTGPTAEVEAWYIEWALWYLTGEARKMPPPAKRLSKEERAKLMGIDGTKERALL